MNSVALHHKKNFDCKNHVMDQLVVDGASGFSFAVEMSRGMDLSMAEYCGIPIGCLLKDKLVKSEGIYSNQERDNNFFLGLMSTCGLENTGQPSCSEGENCCLHGSINFSPASNVKTKVQGDTVIIEGEIRSIFKRWSSLILYRKITYSDSEIQICVEDSIYNIGEEPEQICILYHFNFGAPFLNKDCVLEIPLESVTPKNEIAADMLDQFFEISPQIRGYQPHVFYCTLKKDSNQISTASLINKKYGLKASVSYQTSTLPKFDLWKNFSNEKYVLSFEPCNEIPIGRYEQVEKGIARYILPGNEANYMTKFKLKDCRV